MTDIVLFDERGVRAQKVMMCPDHATIISEWMDDLFHGTVLGWGFATARLWRPSYCVVRMSKGWRVLQLDVGVTDFVPVRVASSWWKPADSTQKRFPNIASVEVYLRTICAYG